jgi:hypothetical protein
VAGPEIDQDVKMSRLAGLHPRAAEQPARASPSSRAASPIVNTNDIEKWLKRIDKRDQSTTTCSAYYSSNPDPLSIRTRRRIDVRNHAPRTSPIRARQILSLPKNR